MYRDARKMPVICDAPNDIEVTLTPLRVLGVAASDTPGKRFVTCVIHTDEESFMLSVITPQVGSDILKIAKRAAKRGQYVYARGRWSDETYEGVSGERYTPLIGEVNIF